MQGSRSHGGGNSGSAQSANSWSCRENFPATGELFCYCGIPAPVNTSRIPKNNGRRFCSCENFKVNRSCRFFVWVDPPLEGATLEDESKENSEIQAGCHEELMKIQAAKHDAIREIDAMKYEALLQVERENTAKKYEALLKDEIDKCKTLLLKLKLALLGSWVFFIFVFSMY
ncbi:hypothetical protein FCV25MIE_10977 [Fagus crenata]